MKSLFKRSSSKNLMETEGSASDANMADDDPQEKEQLSLPRQYSLEGRGNMQQFNLVLSSIFLNVALKSFFTY